MYLGEYLFDVALDLATGGLASKADEAVECGEDTAKIATKQIMLDETKDAISKAKGENWLDLIKGTGELADTGVYFNIGNLDGIDNINDILPRVGLTKDEFNSLRLKDISTLSDQEKKLMRVIRENTPNPTSDTMLQKVIPYQDIEKYMDGNYGQIRGFVAKVDDVASLKTYNEIYNGLGLEYPGSTFNPDIDTSLGVIRFETNAVSQLEIPFGTAMEGKENGAYPFIGNGYAIAPDGQIIPEYKFGNFVDLKNGAQLIQVKKDGTEILLAVYDESKGKFVSLN